MPLRTCVVCGRKEEKPNLLRISIELKPDLTQTVPGRGAYICKNVLCIEKLHNKNTIARSLRRKPSKGDLDSVIKQLKVIDERDDS